MMTVSMKRLGLAVVLSGLLGATLVQGQERPRARKKDKADAPQAETPKVKVAPTAVKPPVWPLPHMKDLPADYLERVLASIVAGTGRMDRLSADDSNDSIGWVRYGMNSLILGQRVEDVNRFFESDKFIVTANPKFGFSLFGVSYVRLYGLMNDRTGVLRGVLSKKAQENFEKGFWQVAKANSKLAEAKRDVWNMEGSENHHLASKTCDFLVAQYLRNIPEYANQKYDDGSTLAEQYEARRRYFLNWLDERAKHGQFVEAASPSYQGDSIAAIYNLHDFAEDPVLRKKAEMYLDLTYANIAEETLLSTRGGPKSRVKVGHEYDGGMSDRGYNLVFGAPGREFQPLGVGGPSTSSYYPPAVVVKLAKDTTGRGIYSFTKRWPGPVAEGGGRKDNDPDGVLWRTLDPQRSILRYGFATPNYVLGSPGLNTAWTDDASMGHRWQGVIFESDPLARIGFELKVPSTNGWHGFNTYYSVQDRNVLVTQKWAPVPPNPRSAMPAFPRVYFSPTLDEVQDEHGWTFARDGKAFAALKVVAGGYEWTPAWKPGERATADNKPFVTAKTEDTPLILVINDAADYNGDFEAFKAAVSAQPIRYENGRLSFATITFHGLSKPPEVNGKPVNLAHEQGYDSPFIRSDWGSGLIHIRKDDDTLVLDFRDANNPKKTIGAPVTDAFPPGVGSEKPIVFQTAAP